MVVVPTEHEVRLHYGRSRSDLFFYVLTLRRHRHAGASSGIRGDVGFDDRWRRPAPTGAGGDDGTSRSPTPRGRRRRRRPDGDAGADDADAHGSPSRPSPVDRRTLRPAGRTATH